MSSWRNPYQENCPATPCHSRNTFKAPIVQSSPDPSPLRSWSNSHSPQLFQSTSQLPPPPTPPQSSILQPSTSTLPPLSIPEPSLIPNTMDQETVILQLQQQLQQMQQQLAQFVNAQAANPPAPGIPGASKKIKVPTPEPFDGRRDKMKAFLRQCNLVFSGDKTNYVDDQDKITYALSLM